MLQEKPSSIRGPIVAGPGSPPFVAAGTTLIIREWTDPGPSYLHTHLSDDEGWHVLSGVLRFEFVDRAIDAIAGTTVFVPAGVPHTYRVIKPGRYLIFLTPKLDRLIARLRALTDQSQLVSTLAEFDTVIVERAS